MFGTSYVGGTQHALALEGSPHLTTVIPVDAVCNMGYASMRNGGAFELRFWNWIMLNAARGSRASRDPATQRVLQEMADQRLDYLSLLPLRPGTTPLKLAPEYESWLVAAMQHGANDDFWRQNNIVDDPQRYQDIPVYLVGGWYDSWASNTTATYRVLSERLRSPVYLIMGPWIHGAEGRHSTAKSVSAPMPRIQDPLAWRLQWYDHWLKPVDEPASRAGPFQTRVRIFVMGTGDGSKTSTGHLFHGGYWRDEDQWPLARAVSTDWHLHPGGGLSLEPAGPEGGATTFQFDPRQPVPTIGGNISSGDGILLQGAWDQRGGPHMWNGLSRFPSPHATTSWCIQSAPLEEDLEVTGELAVNLWVSSTATDTDFTAKLIDVYPPSSDWPGGIRPEHRRWHPAGTLPRIVE